ncbi:MAG: hypothetical protein JNM83_25555 [Myxococcales bacterium]|nr:hypothetical protein [Myxococcales bacterium]
MRTLLLLAAMGNLTACGLSDDAEFRGAPPATQQVTVAFPGVSTMTVRPIKEDDSPLASELAMYYRLSQNMAALLNASGLQLLSVARLMVQLPATTRMGQSRTWGPFEPGGSDPLTYRLVVTQLGEAVFAYTLSARAPTPTSEGEFLTVLEGSVSQGASSGSGRGRMTVLYDNRRKLVPQSCEQGRIDFDFDTLGEPALLDITFHQAGSQNPQNRKCKQDPPRDGRFHAEHSAAGAGSLVFDVRTDVHQSDGSRPLLETVLLHSRWDQTGVGRADGKIADGEVSSDLRNAGRSERYVTFSQCWSELGKPVYQLATPESLRLMASSGDPLRCVPASAALPE